MNSRGEELLEIGKVQLGILHLEEEVDREKKTPESNNEIQDQRLRLGEEFVPVVAELIVYRPAKGDSSFAS
jgi:hypothetical protein